MRKVKKVIAVCTDQKDRREIRVNIYSDNPISKHLHFYNDMVVLGLIGLIGVKGNDGPQGMVGPDGPLGPKGLEGVGGIKGK